MASPPALSVLSGHLPWCRNDATSARGGRLTAEDTSPRPRRLPGLVKRDLRTIPTGVIRGVETAHTRSRAPDGRSGEPIIRAVRGDRCVATITPTPSARDAPGEGVQPGRDVAQRTAAAASSSSSATAPGGRGPPSRTAPGTQPLEHPVALQQLDPQRAPSSSSARSASRVEPAAQRVVRAEAAVGIGEQGARLGQPAGQGAGEHRRVPAGDQHRHRAHPARPRPASAATAAPGRRRPRAGRGRAPGRPTPGGTTSAERVHVALHRRDQLVRPRRRGPGAAARRARWGWGRRP